MFPHKLVSLAAVSVLALGAAGCGQNNPAAPGPTAPAPATTEPTMPSPGESPTVNAAEHNAAAARAIATAEKTANGKAYEIDNEGDDDTWEVDVMVGDRSVETKVSGDGNTVIGSEDDDDADDENRARLAQAKIALPQAIEAALQEVPGSLDDVVLSQEEDRAAWEVTVDAADNADIEVYVSPEDGSIIKVDR